MTNTVIDEIADGIYRLSTFVPDVGPTGFTFNQFLIDDSSNRCCSTPGNGCCSTRSAKRAGRARGDLVIHRSVSIGTTVAIEHGGGKHADRPKGRGERPGCHRVTDVFKRVVELPVREQRSNDRDECGDDRRSPPTRQVDTRITAKAPSTVPGAVRSVRPMDRRRAS